jgi:hypothetical protein
MAVGDNIPYSKVLTLGKGRILLVPPDDSVILGNVSDPIENQDVVTLKYLRKVIDELPTGGLTLVPGDGIEIDDTDPEEPIISLDIDYVIDNLDGFMHLTGAIDESADGNKTFTGVTQIDYHVGNRFYSTSIGTPSIGFYNHVDNGNAAFNITGTGSAGDTNYLNVTGVLGGSNPILSAVGISTNVGLDMLTKGTGAINLTASSINHFDKNGYGVKLVIGASDGSFDANYATFSLGTNNNQSTFDAVYLIGDNLTATGDYAFSVGSGNSAGYAAIAMGYNLIGSGNFSLNVGNASTTSGLKSVAVGNDLLSSGESSLTLGNNLSATGLKSIVIGSGLGASALVNSTPNSVGIGSGVTTPTILVSNVLTIPGLGGGGLQMLTVSNTGVVSAQAIPGGGGGGTDVTLGVIGSSPNANGATINGAGQVLNLEPASGSFGGIITTSAQTLGAGNKTFTDDIIMGSTKSLRNAAGTQFLSIDAGGFINLQGSANCVIRGGGTTSQLTLSASAAIIGAPAISLNSTSTTAINAATGQNISLGTTGTTGETSGDILFSNLRPVYLKSVGALAPNAANQKGSSILHFESNLFDGSSGVLKTFTVSAVASTSVNNLTNLTTRYDGTNLHSTSQTGDFEILASGAGIVLTDSVLATRHRITLVSGTLTVSAAL